MDNPPLCVLAPFPVLPDVALHPGARAAAALLPHPCGTARCRASLSPWVPPAAEHPHPHGTAHRQASLSPWGCWWVARRGGLKSQARNHLCGGMDEPGASPLQPPPKPIIVADLAGWLSAAIPCHPSAVWGLRGDKMGVLGTMAWAGGMRMCQGMGRLGLSFHSRARGGHGNPALFSAPKPSLLSNRCWVLYRRTASLFVRA